MEKEHDLADDLLVGPPRDDALCSQRANAGDLAQTLGRLLNDVEDRLAERARELGGVDRADAADHPGAEIFLDPLQSRRRGRLEKARAKLDPVCAIVRPCSGDLHELAGGDDGRVTDNGDEVSVTARLHADHAESVVEVVKRYALDDAGQHLGGLSRHRSLRHKARCFAGHRSATAGSAPLAQQLADP